MSSHRLLNGIHPEYQYLELLEELALRETVRDDRTGTGVRGVFGRRFEFDLADGFPLLTTKKLHHRLIIGELLWMLSGNTNVRALQAQGIGIWDEWADEIGDLGPVYGAQWRSWGGRVDQIAETVAALAFRPNDRGHVVSAWNVDELQEMALRPCHCLFQFYVEDDGRLSCQLYQRSADIFLGVPFNIASYALLTMMMARVLGRAPGRFIHTFGDVHLYANHIDQAWTQLARSPRPFPTMALASRTDMDSWEPGDFTLHGYNPHPHIPAPVSK